MSHRRCGSPGVARGRARVIFTVKQRATHALSCAPVKLLERLGSGLSRGKVPLRRCSYPLAARDDMIRQAEPPAFPRDSSHELG
jgi:hypothetical protein